ncbi:unnamed protein product [Prunus brigantina]
MEEVKLFGTWLSLYGYGVIWPQLKGVRFGFQKNSDLANKSDLLLQYNPVHKKIPVPVHNGKPIDETWPQNPLLSDGPHERALARFLTKFIDEKVILYIFTSYKFTI